MWIFVFCLIFFTLLFSRYTTMAPHLSNEIDDQQIKWTKLQYNDCSQPFFKPKLDEYNNKFERVKRIVNGDTAIAHSWPWTVFLRYNGTFFCGGTLIDPLHNGYQSDTVLTAAHCVENKNYTLIDVTLGAHELVNDNESSRVTVGLSQVGIHIEFKKISEHDIAIILLEKPVKFNAYIKPICLPKQSHLEPLSDCYATGWGLMSEQSQSGAENLQQILLVTGEIESEDLTSFDDTKGIHYGDSGSPLVCSVGGTWIQFRIASSSSIPSEWPRNETLLCARRNMTTNFVRTSHYANWIKGQAIYLKHGFDWFVKPLL